MPSLCEQNRQCKEYGISLKEMKRRVMNVEK